MIKASSLWRFELRLCPVAIKRFQFLSKQKRDHHTKLLLHKGEVNPTDLPAYTAVSDVHGLRWVTECVCVGHVTMTTHLCQFHSASFQIEKSHHNRSPPDALRLIRAVSPRGQRVHTSVHDCVTFVEYSPWHERWWGCPPSLNIVSSATPSSTYETRTHTNKGAVMILNFNATWMLRYSVF